MFKKCEHDFVLSSITGEKTKWVKVEKIWQWQSYKVGSLICRKCGAVKQVELDVCRKRV